MKMKFELGRVVCTHDIWDWMNSNADYHAFVEESFAKYINADWGETCKEDADSNDDAVESGERILAVYIYEPTNTTIWIITEWDRSVTTILFPSEY